MKVVCLVKQVPRADSIEFDQETKQLRREGVPLLLQLARSPADPALQKEAMRVLGRSKDERAARFFQEVLSR